MFEKYEKQQPLAYKILLNSINNNKLNHAYLFETNGFNEAYNMVISFVKCIFCQSKKINKTNCNNCIICNKIQNNYYSELKIINPEGLVIKKDQIKDLQKEFATKTLEGPKKIYIINQAEKMNAIASNALLKFLEEPAENIIAILITENKNKIIETILSRCQIISLNNNEEENRKITGKNITSLFNNSIVEIENIEEIIKKSVSFVEFYEKNKIETLLYLSKIWFPFIKNKEESIAAFNIIIYFYKDVLNFKMKKNIEVFSKDMEIIENIAKINNIESICQKIKLYINMKENIMKNINSNLLMDKLVLNLEKVKND